MTPLYRAVLLMRRRDGGVEVYGSAMSWGDREAIADGDPPAHRDGIHRVVDAVKQGRRPSQQEITQAIILAAKRANLLRPDYLTIVVYGPEQTSVRIYCFDREIDHRDGIAMLDLANTADAEMRLKWSQAIPSVPSR